MKVLALVLLIIFKLLLVPNLVFAQKDLKISGCNKKTVRILNTYKIILPELDSVEMRRIDDKVFENPFRNMSEEFTSNFFKERTKVKILFISKKKSFELSLRKIDFEYGNEMTLCYDRIEKGFIYFYIKYDSTVSLISSKIGNIPKKRRGHK